MIYRKLDSVGDYSFGGSLNSFHLNTADGVGQAVLTRLKLWEAEWFIDLREGTPYVGGILGKYTMETFDQVVKDRILNTQEVTEILAYSSVYDGDLRSVVISVTISTSYGNTTVTGVL
jgi:hypothetical protein